MTACITTTPWMPLPFSDSGYGGSPALSAEQWRGFVDDGFDWGKVGSGARTAALKMATTSFFISAASVFSASKMPTKPRGIIATLQVLEYYSGPQSAAKSWLVRVTGNLEPTSPITR